jgi:hypothetical protein
VVWIRHMAAARLPSAFNRPPTLKEERPFSAVFGRLELSYGPHTRTVLTVNLDREGSSPTDLHRAIFPMETVFHVNRSPMPTAAND